MKKKPPSTTGHDGKRQRDGKGRFAAGNTLSRGYPFAKHVQKLRARLFEAVSVDDVDEIAKQLIALATAGDLRAIQTLFSYIFGPPIAVDIVERIERLEAAFAEQER